MRWSCRKTRPDVCDRRRAMIRTRPAHDPATTTTTATAPAPATTDTLAAAAAAAGAG